MSPLNSPNTISNDDALPVRRALISVADKSGLIELGRALSALGVALVSSGSTAATLREAGVPVTPVAEVTGAPEMLEGRVKTLHPRIHGGILADKSKPSHLAQLADQGIEPFDLVVSNLYPFREAVAAGVSEQEVIEQIDIGGPALVRAAAKNFGSVGIVVSPQTYPALIEELRSNGGLRPQTRRRLAVEAFAHIAAYDDAVSEWFTEQIAPSGETVASPAEPTLPTRVHPSFELVSSLRYGENPHQRAALYATQGGGPVLGGAEVLQGKEMSFNNWLDAEAARGLAALFDEPVCVIVKHHNPCGVAQAATLGEAYARALACDEVSAFGGIVAFNREVDEAATRAMAGVFTEVVIGPAFAPDALAAFAGKQNLRVVRAPSPRLGGLEIRPVEGGALVQDADTVTERREDMRVVTTVQPTEDQWADLLFAWKVASRAKSNAIILASGLVTVAVGAGQMNRVTSVDIAARHAGEKARGSVMASDAFFPFRDNLDRAAQAGIAAVIEPGGSVRDPEVIAAAEEHGMAMVFTGRRHFRH
jgi:phosphoribosylaminoimidazolecarboxamide formyltransferase/IMP cyclohydrolase